MKAPPFEYHRPTSLDEAVRLAGMLENHKFLAGGQSLVPMMNFRLLYPNDLIDINHIGALAGIDMDGEHLRIGAMTRQRDLERSAEILLHAPIFAEAVRQIGHRQTRNRGTLGGSLCHLDPSAELPALAILHDAILEIRGTSGTRTARAADFIEGAMSPALNSGEILVAASFPLWPKRHGYCFLEHARRSGDFAIASAACLLTRSADGSIDRMAICIGGLSDRPLRLTAAEDLLIGVEPTMERIALAAECCSNLHADGNVHASADYKRGVAIALARRSIAQAVKRFDAIEGSK